MSSERFTICLLLACLAVSPTTEAKKNKSGDKVMLSGKFAPIDRAELELTEVPYAPAAPAVVLLDAEQQDYAKLVTGLRGTRTTYQRRIKILTDAGIEDYSDASLELNRHVELGQVKARTILPDGTEVNASDNINRDTTETGETIVSIAFPRVRVGAILEFIIDTWSDHFYTTAWSVQERIPVLRSRLIVNPPDELDFRSQGSHLRPEEVDARRIETALGTSYIWQFENIAPIPLEPNEPPFSEMAKTLYIVPQSLEGRTYSFEFASSWLEWNKQASKSWDAWLTRQGECKKLARSITEGMERAEDKAEAIRRVLRDRIRVAYHSDVALRANPDEALAIGVGSSADVAGVTIAMLNEVGVDAHLVTTRRRHRGRLPLELPMPILLDDMLVRVRDGDAQWYFSPVADMPVTKLPGYARGVHGMPLDKKTKELVELPDFAAEDNKATREATLTLGDNGTVSATSEETYRGIWAEHWRSELRDESADERKTIVQRALQRWMPGAILATVEFEHLDDASDELTLRSRFTVENYAIVAGKRTLVNTNLFSRVDLQDWAAETRKSAIDLGGAFESLDTVTLQLPPDLAELHLPESADFDAGHVGFFKTRYQHKGGTMVARRHLRLDVYRFPPEAYDAVKGLFSDIATQDDKPVVILTR